MITRFARRFLLSPTLVVSIALIATPASAEWVQDGNEIGISYQSPLNHQVCPDGEGGLILARANAGNVVADRIDAHGRRLWPAASCVCSRKGRGQPVPTRRSGTVGTSGDSRSCAGSIIIVWRPAGFWREERCS